MRAVIQKVTRAQVDVLDGESRETCGQIGAGLMVLLGVGHDDGAQDARYIADKIAYLRIFEDENGRLNRSVQDIGGNIEDITFEQAWKASGLSSNMDDYFDIDEAVLVELPD